MKKSKLLILLLSVCCAVALCFGAVTAMAAEETGVTVSSLWSVSDSSVKTEIGTNGGLKTTLLKDSSATLANEVDFTNFKAVMALDSLNFEKLVLRFKGKHAMDTTTTNDVVLTSNGTTVKAGVNTGAKTEIANANSLTVEYSANTGAFKINGVEIGTGKAVYMPYGTFGVYSETATPVTFTLTEMNGETFQKTGDAILDGKAPVIVMHDAFTNKTVPVNYRATFYYCMADAVSNVTMTVNVKPTDSTVAAADYGKYFEKGIVSDTYAVVIFHKAGEYELTFTAKDTSNKSVEKKITVKAEGTDTTAPVYMAGAVSAYQDMLTEMESEIIMSESFKLPLPPVQDDYAPAGLIRYVMRYMAPSASTWSYSTITTGRPSFTPSAVGTYRIQLVPVDLAENRANYDDCPEFTVTVKDTTVPKVTVNFNETQYIGIAVKLSDVSITETSAYETVKVLEKFNDATTQWEKIEDVVDSFTPTEKGSYRYTVTVVDEYLNKTEVVKSFTVIEPAKVNQVQNWISKNYLSVIFIGIAFACLVAIVVLEIVYKKSMKK
ncbi:MAG: hypothetical protein IKC56_01250 [Clostridia bacterium]|nr:hypothetical protein [Clostridia bacterium]